MNQKWCLVNIWDVVVSPFFDTLEELENYIDNGGEIDNTWMCQAELVNVW